MRAYSVIVPHALEQDSWYKLLLFVHFPQLRTAKFVLALNLYTECDPSFFHHCRTQKEDHLHFFCCTLFWFSLYHHIQHESRKKERKKEIELTCGFSYSALYLSFLITVVKVSKLRLIWLPSFNLAPSAFVWEARSLPARSTRFYHIT